MHRQAREWIITIEVMKLERRQALESGRRAREPQPRPIDARWSRDPLPLRSIRPQPPA
jgi:hypothetical protein